MHPLKLFFSLTFFSSATMEAFISTSCVYSSVMPSAFKGLGLPLIVLRAFVSKPLIMDFFLLCQKKNFVSLLAFLLKLK